MNKDKIIKFIREEIQNTMFNWKETYPELEIIGDKVRLYHFGPIGIDYLDPIEAKKNTQPHTPDFNFWGHPRVFFYTNLKDKERRITGHLYTIDYPLDRLYPVSLDSKNLKEKHCSDKTDASKKYCYLNTIKDQYDGYISNWNNTLRADIWVPIAIPEEQKVKQEKWNYAQDLNKFLNDKAFQEYKEWKNKLKAISPNEEEKAELNNLVKNWEAKGFIKD